MYKIEICSCSKKNHHFVQESISKKFKKTNKPLYILDLQSILIKEKNPSKTFQEFYLYPKETLSEIKKDKIIKTKLDGINQIFKDLDKCIECNIGKYVETPFSKITDEIIKKYNNNNNLKINISENEKCIIKNYFFFQFGRTPQMKDFMIQAAKKWRKTSNKSIQNFKENEYFWIYGIISNFFDKSQYRLFNLKNIKILINFTNLPFILGSQGLFMTGNVRPKIEILQIYLPIHPNIIILLENDNDGIEIVKDETFIHELNLLNLKNSESTSFISGDKEYLEKLKKEI